MLRKVSSIMLGMRLQNHKTITNFVTIIIAAATLNFITYGNILFPPVTFAETKNNKNSDL